MRRTHSALLVVTFSLATLTVAAPRAVADRGEAAVAAHTAAARWGEHGHLIIGRVAAERLPDDVPVLRAAASQLSYLNPEPDRWRSRDERSLDPAMDAKHAPEHYIDFELLSPGSMRAPNRLAYADSLRAVDVPVGSAGLLPWRILEMTQRLRVGFRDWRAATDAETRAWIEQRIINDAGILGHYVADGSNPHHTSIHHNGWVGENPHGYTTDRTFHSRFESVFVREQITLDDVRRAPSTALALHDPLRPAVWAYLERSHSFLERLYQLEQQEPFGATTQSPAHREFALERLSAGADMLRDLWYSAWVTSEEGEPGR